ncbi:hypothetical protein CRE_14507 [Caenorhabditis remanei]|uniref:Uncharacterized protein n=1 Tax=Caenorhabditis remanei TaxID=31234 RepID=E3M996_CAERE|nr:hypothetical protein CRE_14507 [Caenorhabditis remanei]
MIPSNWTNHFDISNSPIYPIVDHFFLYSCLTFAYIILPFLFWFVGNATAVALIVIGLGLHFLMVTVSPIFNILLIILTLQRFVLYYVENSEKYASFKILHWRLFFGALYLISIIFNFGIRVAKYFFYIREPVNCSTTWTDNENINFIDDTYMNISFALEVLVVISAVLYIPMLCSIQKLAYLPSVAQYEPQKYVKYQALLISVIKMCVFLLAFYSGEFLSRNVYLFPQREMLFNFFHDSNDYSNDLYILQQEERQDYVILYIS